jgi:hypothetical protein
MSSMILDAHHGAKVVLKYILEEYISGEVAQEWSLRELKAKGVFKQEGITLPSHHAYCH